MGDVAYDIQMASLLNKSRALGREWRPWKGMPSRGNTKCKGPRLKVHSGLGLLQGITRQVMRRVAIEVTKLPFSKCLVSEEPAFLGKKRKVLDQIYGKIHNQWDTELAVSAVSQSPPKVGLQLPLHFLPVSSLFPPPPASAILQFSQMKQQFQDTHLSLQRKKEKNQSSASLARAGRLPKMPGAEQCLRLSELPSLKLDGVNGSPGTIMVD